MSTNRKTLLKGLTSRTFTAALLASVAGIGQADHLATGNELMRYCTASPDNFCAGYIGGVIDTSHALFCIPPEIPRKEVVNTTIAYLRDHPDKLGLYAPNLVITATRTAFPCNDGV